MRDAAGRWRRRLRAPELVLGLGLCVAGAALFQKINASTFFFDEWSFLINRRGISLDVFLRPHNDHLSLVLVAIYKVVVEVFGMTVRWPYALLAVAGNVLCAALLYRLLVPRTGPWPAVGAALVLATLGPAWEDLLWPFQVGLFVGLAAVLAALLAVQRDDTRGDVAASALLVIGVGTASIGLVGIVGVAAYVVARGRDVLVRLGRTLVAPIVLYPIWYFAYRGDIEQYREAAGLPPPLSRDRILAVPDFVATLASDATAAIVGLEEGFGAALLLGFAVLVGGFVLRTPRPGPTWWASLALALGFLFLTALGRAPVGANASRYLYPCAAFFLLLAGMLLARPPAARAVLAGACVVAFAIWSNTAELRNADFIATTGAAVETNLAMLELARGRAPADFQPDPGRALDVRAGPYFAAIDDYGSPAASLEEVARRPPQLRAEADGVLARALGVALTAVPRPRSGCVRVGPAGGRPTLDRVLPATGLAIVPGSAPVEVRLRRFGDGYGDPVAVARPGTTAHLRVPPDRSSRPWHVQLASGGRFTACPL